MSFESDMVGFETKVRKRTDNIRKRATMNLCGHIIDDTPVLTGALVAHWGLDSFDKNYVDPDKEATKARVRSQLRELRFDETYSFTNPAPYAYKAEFAGWGGTPPYQMVSVNLSKWDMIVKEASFEIRRGVKL